MLVEDGSRAKWGPFWGDIYYITYYTHMLRIWGVGMYYVYNNIITADIMPDPGFEVVSGSLQMVQMTP